MLSTRQFAIAICISVPIWGLECLAVMSILRSLGIGVGAEGLMLAVSSGSISTIIPSAPGFVGSYNFAYVIALGLVGVDATLAVVASTSVMVHLFGSVVVLAFLIAVAVFLSRIRQTQRT